MQDNGGQVGSQDFGIGVFRAVQKVRFVVQTETDPRRHTATPACPLVGTGLGNRFNWQPLYFRAHTVPADARNASINHVANTGHGQRGLSHVGGQHNPPSLVALKHPVLFLVTQAGIQRQHFGMTQVSVAQHLAHGPDLPLAWQKNQYIPRRLLFLPFMLFNLVQRREDTVGPALIPVVLVPNQGAISNIYRKGTTADFNHRRFVEKLAEALHLDRGRGDDDFQIRALRQQLLEIAEQKINIQAALVGLIDNQRVIAIQKTVMLHFCQQDAVGHYLDPGRFRGVVGKPHLVPDLLPYRLTQFFGNPAGNTARGDTPGLGMANKPADAPPQVQANLRNLSGFTGPGLTSNDHHLMVVDGITDVLDAIADRQPCGKGHRLVQCLTLTHLVEPLIQPLRHLFQVLVTRVTLATAYTTNDAGGLLLVTGVQLAHHRFDSGPGINGSFGTSVVSH